MDQQILRIQQTCALLGLSRSTLYRMIAKGEFPAPTRLSTRAVGWQAGTVHAWLSSHSPGAPVSGLAEPNAQSQVGLKCKSPG